MPNWLLPLICLIVLGGFIYVGFWKGLGNGSDKNNTGGHGDGALTDSSSSGGP